MAQFKEAVLTRKGIALLAKAQAENKTIAFTKAVTGNGTYEEGEDLSARTALKSQQQAFAPTTISRQNETNVYIRFSITNNPPSGPLTHGYYVTEIGIIADDPDEGEILYALAIAEDGKADYLTAYNDLLPAVIGVDFLIEVSNADNVTITTDLSAYATNADLDAKGDSLAYSEEAQRLYLKSNGQVISSCIIRVQAGNVGLATEEEVRAMARELMDSSPSPIPSEIATDEEVEDTIEHLDDL